jgi:hypothetical protein
MERATERAQNQSPLMEARRVLSHAYNNYFAGVQTSEEVQMAEAKIYTLLKAEFAKPIGGRTAA